MTASDERSGGGRRCLTCGRRMRPGEELTAALIERPHPPARRSAGSGKSGARSRPGPAGSGGGGAAGQSDFVRLDYCRACWPASPWAAGGQLLDEGESAYPIATYGAEPVAVWTVRVEPAVKPRKALVDDHVLMNFFLRLGDSEQPERRRFRFLLMLILMRHKKLRHQGIDKSGESSNWLVSMSPAMAEALGTPAEAVYQVVDPRLDEGQLQQVAEQLSQILQQDLDEPAVSPDSGLGEFAAEETPP